MSGMILQHPEQAQSLLIWLDWDADEWGWVKGDEQKLVQARSREALEEVAEAHMHGHMAAHVSAKGTADCNQLSMSLYIDGTAIEVFTSSGKAASTRMYWETPERPQVSAWSAGGTSAVEGCAWQMDSIWIEGEFGTGNNAGPERGTA